MSRQHVFIKPKIQIKYLMKALFVVLVTVCVFYVFIEIELTASLKGVVADMQISQIMWLLRKTFFLVTIILTLAFSILSIFSSHPLAGAVCALERIIGNLTDGNLKTSFDLRKSDELKEVAVQLQKMVSRTRNAVDEDRQRVNQIKELLSEITMSLSKSAPQGEIITRLKDIEDKMSLINTHFKI